MVGYPHGLGDCILATPALRERARLTGDHITFAMLERFRSAELFTECPHVDEIVWLPDPWNDFDNPDQGFAEVRRLCEQSGVYDDLVFVDKGVVRGMNKLADMMRRLKVGHSPHKQTEVYIREEDEQRAASLIPDEPFLFIHGHSPSLPPKDFPAGYAREWNDKHLGIKRVIEVGVDFQEDEMPIGAQFAIMRAAAGVCLIDSVFYHACCALNKKIDIAYFNRGAVVYERVKHLHPVEENVVFTI